MKTLIILLLTAAVLRADPRFQITKSTIDGGGARAVAGTRFTLTGTIGQPEAAPRFSSASGRFALEPGFWGQYSVVPTPGLPELTMRPSQVRNSAVLAWPVAATGYILEQSPDLTASSWTPVGIAVVDTATEHTVTVPMSAQRKFFRLSRP